MKSQLAKLFLRVRGWTLEGGPPAARSYVLVAAPHTSNWDLLYLLAAAWAFRVRVSWMGKHTLFRGPMGSVMRFLGGVPVRRNRSSDMVQQMARAFAAKPSLVLTVPPEGTRSYVAHWKSGFYHIARAASVPIVLSRLDYGTKVAALGPALIPTDDLRSDMDEVRSFYAGAQGKYPDRAGEIRLKEET